MGLYSNHKNFYNQPIRLDATQQQEPIVIINYFFGSHHLYEVRQLLWDIITTALTSSDSFDEPYDRRYLISFYEELELLIEACFVMSDKRLQIREG